MTPSVSYQEVHLRDYLYVLRKRRKILIAFFILAVAANFFLTASATVLYRATATILIERENPNIVNFQEVMAFDASTSDYYQTQYEMIKSRSLIERLIQKEDLDKDPFIVALRKGGTLKRWLQKWESYFPEGLKDFFGKRSIPDIFINQMLNVEPVRNTRLVAVSIMHPDPARAAGLANRLVDLFIQQNLQNRFLIAQRATEMISEQISEMKERVTEAERKLQEYKEKHNLVNIPSIHEKDRFIQDAKLELVKLQAEEARLSTRYLPAHPKRIHIRSQIESLEEKIREEEQKNLEMSRKALQYAQLEREAESARQIYEALLSRLEETHSESRMQASNILVVDRAKVPSRPYKPRPFLNFLVAVCVGLIGGVSLAFFAEYLDSTVKIPEDVEKGLGLELFGTIPVGEHMRKSDPAKGELFLTDSRHTPTSEAFRALRTALLFRLRRIEGCRLILVTSPNPEEGKSTVSLNLAAAFEQNHLRVLLMDADLRKPRLHQLFDLPDSPGLTELLESDMTLEEAIHSNVGELGFDFLSCGAPSDHPTEVLGSILMKQLVDKLKQIYDIILIDSPPYLAVADVPVLSEYSDAIVIIARYHKTDKRHLKELRRRFNEADNKVMGIVINQVSPREKDYYYHQYYYYGYGNTDRGK